MYFGLKDSGWRKYYWLDVRKLSSNLLMFNQELVMTKYFTSRVKGPSDKAMRQSIYLDALNTLKDGNDFEIYYGHYQCSPHECPTCHALESIPSEKMTDVNIATELIMDAVRDRFDTAILISADSDLVAPIQAILNNFPSKRVIVAFPPKRASVKLASVASGHFTISRANIAQSRLPERVTGDSGFELFCPPVWK